MAPMHCKTAAWVLHANRALCLQRQLCAQVPCVAFAGLKADQPCLCSHAHLQADSDPQCRQHPQLEAFQQLQRPL